MLSGERFAGYSDRRLESGGGLRSRWLVALPGDAQVSGFLAREAGRQPQAVTASVFQGSYVDQGDA
jgi:hypothetical protein